MACGVLEPAVDEWEVGTRRPTWQQLEALAELTGATVRYFCEAAPVALAPGFLYGPRRCEVLGRDVRAPIVPVDAPSTLFDTPGRGIALGPLGCQPRTPMYVT